MANIDSSLNKNSANVLMDGINNRFVIEIPRSFPTSGQGNDEPVKGIVSFSELTSVEKTQIGQAILIVINKLISRVGGNP